MESKQQLKQKLDQAIDEMDLDGICETLDRLTGLEDHPIAAESPELFAARIKKLDKERKQPMKMSKTIRGVFAAAAIIAMLSVGVYASGAWQRFAFVKDDQMVVVQTGDGKMSQKQAEELAKEGVHVQVASSAEVPGGQLPDPDQMVIGEDEIQLSWTQDAPVDSDINLSVTEKETADYASAQEAAKALGLPLALPEIPDGMAFASAKASSLGDDKGQSFGKTMWVNYDGEKRSLGITVDWMKISEKITAVTYHGIEPGSGGSYKTAKGYEFTTVREDGSDIATIFCGEYEYTLVFNGFTESERRQMLDSVDLSVYQ